MSFTKFENLDYRNGDKNPVPGDTLRIITPFTSNYNVSWFTGAIERNTNINTTMTTQEIHNYISTYLANQNYPIWIFYNNQANSDAIYTIFLKKSFGDNGKLVKPNNDFIFEGGYLNIYYSKLFFTNPDPNNSKKITYTKMGMPFKPTTMTQGASFAMGRRTFINKVDNPSETSQQSINRFKRKKFNNTAGEHIYKRKINAIGNSSTNHLSQEMSFSSIDKPTVNSALRKVRSGGSVAPKKKGII
jgi:hypothetical protein